MPNAFGGNYPIETRSGEIERLDMQADAVAPDARAMLDRIGVDAGWQCLDVGCGPRGITDLLCEYVGPSGRRNRLSSPGAGASSKEGEK